MRAEATLQCLRWIDAPTGVRVVCGNETAVAELRASVLEPSLFASLHRTSPLISWADALVNPALRRAFTDVVPAALAVYDLSDLMAMLAPAKLQR